MEHNFSGAEIQENADTHLSNELRRKAFHFLSAGIPIGYYLTDYATALWVIGGLLGLAVLIEYARLSHSKINEWFHDIFGRMLRRGETDHYSAATYLLISSFLVIIVFHKEIAVLCLLYLIFGDGAAAIVGMKFGRTRIFDKSLEGTLGFLIVCIAVGFLFPDIPFSVRLTGSVTAAAVELLPMRTSDNLRIPIMSGSIMELMLVAMAHNQPAGSTENDVLVWLSHQWSVFCC
jgi:dolichol kinase